MYAVLYCETGCTEKDRLVIFMYNVYPYMYRNFRAPNRSEQESAGQQVPFKRGDLEGYVAAKDFASKPYAACTRANALAQIHSGNILRADMTPKEYINLLIKQGQVPDKHFKYHQTDTGYEISEINSNKEVTKKVIFNKPEYDSDTPVICKYYTPDTGRQFKEVRYRADGGVDTKTEYEDFFDESETIEQMEKLEELKKAGPQTVPVAQGGNPFMQEPPDMPSTSGGHKLEFAQL